MRLCKFDDYCQKLVFGGEPVSPTNFKIFFSSTNLVSHLTTCEATRIQGLLY